MDRQVADEINQHFEVVVEGLHSKIDIIAEGHASLTSEIEDCGSELPESFDETRSTND